MGRVKARVIEVAKREQGQVFIAALILLSFGTLLVSPVVTFMGTGLKAVSSEERNTFELYAADSGVSYALYKLAKNRESFGPVTLPSTINNRTVTVTVLDLGGDVFKITSTAVTGVDHSTTINSHAPVYAVPFFWAQSVTSGDDLDVDSNALVDGDVYYRDELDNHGTITGDATQGGVSGWPDEDDLSTYYWVEAPVTAADEIDVSAGTEESPYQIGPLRTQGDLELNGSGVARLDGTLYVGDDLVMKPGATLLLNNQVIYVEDDIDFQPNCHLQGPGIIIAVEDITFKPGILSEDYIFLLSIDGDATLQPGNEFYGAIAAGNDIEIKSGSTVYEVMPPALDFPEDPSSDVVYRSIVDYSIN